MMRRIFGLLTVAAVMAVMMVVSAAPAFAAPGGPPIDVIHGQEVADFTRAVPPNPVHGQQVSLAARDLTFVCGIDVDTTC